MRLCERALGAHDALRDGTLRDQERTRDLSRRQASQETQRERDLGLSGEHRMAGDEHQAQEVIADVVVHALAMSGTAISLHASSRPNSSSLRSCSALRRKRSIARCLAVAMSQAPGLSGTPDFGHCSSAATRASWARSSATPTSRTIRVNPAMSRATRFSRPRRLPDGCRQPWSQLTITPSSIRRCKRSRGNASCHAALPRLRPQIFKSGRGFSHVSRKIRKLLHLANLYDAVIITGAACAHSMASSLDFT